MDRATFRRQHRAFRTANRRLPQFDDAGMLTTGVVAVVDGLRLYRANGIVGVYRLDAPASFGRACILMMLCFSFTSKGFSRSVLQTASGPDFRGPMPLPR